MKTMTDYALEARERAYAPYSGFPWGQPCREQTAEFFWAAMWKTHLIP